MAVPESDPAHGNNVDCGQNDGVYNGRETGSALDHRCHWIVRMQKLKYQHHDVHGVLGLQLWEYDSRLRLAFSDGQE